MLAPPGICLCHADSPAVYFVVSLLKPSTEPPVPTPDDDDHVPGCPASPLAAGLGLQPAPVEVPPLAAAGFVDVTAPAPLPWSPLLSFSPLPDPPPGPSLYLADCVLLI
jgi:hypothetical protein